MHRFILAAYAVAFIAGRGGSGDGSMPADNSTGILNISITDAAVDGETTNVDFLTPAG